MQTHHDEVVDCAKGSGWVVRIVNPFKDLDKETLLFCLVMRNESWGGDVKRDAAAKKAKDEQTKIDEANRAAAAAKKA